MWIMSRYGFFSIVCAHDQTERVGEPRPDRTGLMMIRARKRSHLEALIEYFPKLGKIVENQGTDYPFRVFVTKRLAANVLERLGEEIDYTNFKDAVGKGDLRDPDYLHFLHRIWSLGVALEQRVPETLLDLGTRQAGLAARNQREYNFAENHGVSADAKAIDEYDEEMSIRETGRAARHFRDREEVAATSPTECRHDIESIGDCGRPGCHLCHRGTPYNYGTRHWIGGDVVQHPQFGRCEVVKLAMNGYWLKDSDGVIHTKVGTRELPKPEITAKQRLKQTDLIKANNLGQPIVLLKARQHEGDETAKLKPSKGKKKLKHIVLEKLPKKMADTALRWEKSKGKGRIKSKNPKFK